MMERKFSKYFWRNMKLFTSIFFGICVVVALFFLWNKAKYQEEKMEIRYQSSAENCSAEIDNRLSNIRKLMNEISGITWVKKLSTSSDVFLKEFTELQRLECQAELLRYFATDDSIVDIAVYMPERGTVLNQQGWFSELEYKSSISKRCDLDIDAVLEAAKQRSSSSAFGEAEYNIGNRRNIALVNSLIDVASPPTSLIIILNRNTFNQNMAKLNNGEIIGIEVLNLSGEPIFYTSREISKGYQIEIASKEYPIYYRITFPQPSDLLERYGVLSSAYISSLFMMLLLAVLLSYLLALYNTRPLQNLVGKISKMAGELSGTGSGDTEFEQIENSFMFLWSQQKSLEDGLKENYNLARKYALLLILLGDENLAEMSQQYFEALEIPFTEEQIYFVWMVIQKTETAENISILDMFTELQPQVDSVEEVTIAPGQTFLIVGQDPDRPLLNCDET
ncbi:MAG: hypothetical protein J6C37_04810, partial [Roseburia sp.]|nr:hypothetical protein [Roseburia sp.]